MVAAAARTRRFRAADKEGFRESDDGRGKAAGTGRMLVAGPTERRRQRSRYRLVRPPQGLVQVLVLEIPEAEVLGAGVIGAGVLWAGVLRAGRK